MDNERLDNLTTGHMDAAAMGRVCRFLETAEITTCDLLLHGSNRVFLVTLVKENQVCRAIYKPRRGETPLYDFPDGSLYKREYAAFLVSQALAWSFVPPTVIRRGPWGVGSVQWFVESRNRLIFESKQGIELPKLKQVALFDMVVNNADRKFGHFLIGLDERLWVVDHGLTFNSVPKLRTVLWDFAGQRIPGELAADVAALRKKLAGKQPLRNALLNLLHHSEVEALESRIDGIINAPVFVHPRSHWSIPWPPV